MPELGCVGRRELVEHIDEIVERLADWLDGQMDRAATLWTIAEAHVQQRVRLGLTLGVVLREYSRLRVCIHEALKELGAVTPLDRVLDLAAAHSADHYLAQREEQRGRLVGMLAHDLRSPLTCISMGCEMLIAGLHSAPQRALLDQVFDSTDRMQRMINDVLGLARAQVGDHIPITAREQDLGEIVRSAIAEMRLAFGEVAIAAELVGDLRGLFDGDRVHQLMDNLLRNAVEHGGGATLVTVRQTEDGDNIVLDVRSRGPSEPPASMLIAELPARRKRPTNMRGFGLYIVDQIARAHGARVELSSFENETIVTVLWPKRLRAHESRNLEVEPCS